MVFLYNRHIRKFWRDIGRKWMRRRSSSAWENYEATSSISTASAKSSHPMGSTSDIALDLTHSLEQTSADNLFSGDDKV